MSAEAIETETEVKVEDGADGDGTPTQLLRNALYRFRFDADSVPSLRRSPRRNNLLKHEEVESELQTLPSGSRSSKKRPASTTVGDTDVKRAKTPRGKVGIAPPERYAHLQSLNDHLGQEAEMLDVMFCGINPGKMSATVGHHFAHPTNHFWRCLHGAGLTDRLLDASEDGTLPDNYRLGLTNLVTRPSSQAAELAHTEYTDGVPALLRKIVLKRPRVVCFVGKQIWESFIKAAAPRLGSNQPVTSPAQVRASTEEGSSTVTTGPSTDGVTTAGRGKTAPKKRVVKQELVYDLQPYKVVHPDPNARVRETLFFVVVSTSGLVAGYQRSEKIQQFTRLKQRVDEVKAGSLDTSDMTVIQIPPELL